MLASHEVRWFFNGPVGDHPNLKKWFETYAPLNPIVSPRWLGRKDDKPDVYLVIPEHQDASIKWREGTLQIKGRLSSLGTQLFTGGHVGMVERWAKWTYESDTIKNTFRNWFEPKESVGPRRVEVSKTRALRKVRMSPLGAEMQEIDGMVDRGAGIEVTDLSVMGRNGTRELYCSVCFEAFPDDSEMHDAFSRLVNAFVKGLNGNQLTESNSMGYPAWLLTIPF